MRGLLTLLAIAAVLASCEFGARLKVAASRGELVVLHLRSEP